MILIRHGQSEFNVLFSVTRRDPGIRDPHLTEEGCRQAAAVADHLAGRGLTRLIASPYTRALETAEIIAERLGLPLAVDPVVGERVAFACDIGTAGVDLKRRWPHLELDHVGERWWPAPEENEESLSLRCTTFRRRMAVLTDWSGIGVVTHWGFIRGLTGLTLGNGAAVRIDPTDPDTPPEPLFPA